MILTGADIKQYIKHGGLRFEPELNDEQFQQNGVDLVLAAADILRLGHGRFTLGVTRERVEVPNDLMAFVQLRSTWARHGIMLPPTIVDAGFQGTLTLEIASFADPAELLPVGERFVHLIFAKLCTPTAPYAGKYQGQSGITGAR